jgi:hypothetical protein
VPFRSEICERDTPFDFPSYDNKPILSMCCFPRSKTKQHAPQRPAHPTLVPLPSPLQMSLLQAPIAHRHPRYIQFPLWAGAKHPVLVHENEHTPPPNLAFPRIVSLVGAKRGGVVSCAGVFVAVRPTGHDMQISLLPLP